MRVPNLVLASSVAVVAGVHVEKHGALPGLGPLNLASRPYRSYKHDCWKKRPVSKSFSKSFLQNPGAGIDIESIEPFQTVEKDGFMMIDCVEDAMLEHGDKHGDNKLGYNIQANVSIIHLEDVVPREDRKPMTHAYCFEFCRTVPDMLFFGINNGGDCYCAPFYRQKAGDSSDCDSPCYGDDATMCGGSSKSSIFSMHHCDDTEKDMETASEDLEEAVDALDEVVGYLKDATEKGEADANTVQESLGKAGDPDGSNLCQEAKIYAGELLHAAEDAEDLIDTMKSHIDEAKDLKGKDMKKFKNVKKAEKVTVSMQKGISRTIMMSDKIQELLDDSSPRAPEDKEDTKKVDEAEEHEERVEDSSKQYAPIMFFVDKKFEEAPSTCAGDMLQIIFGKSMDECAYECDDMLFPDKCVGFQYFGEGDGFCILFSKFKKAQYWKGCMPEEEEEDGKKFLQVQGAKKREGDEPFAASCVVKMADFEGLTLKPDKSGKCKHCLKEVTEANRCYE